MLKQAYAPVTLVETYAHLWTIKQVAAFVNCSESHIRRQCEAGKFPLPARIGALVRWTPSSVTTWLAQQEGAGRYAAGAAVLA